ncbi:MAG: response regulator transcription factor [Chitinophagales bacterium]|nr:response regulator transcription factor [Chitinophagaceae bacterium]MCB9065323.1 response regulator transcription factor [Chitinophagales bacterium]
MPTNRTIKLVIADDHRLFREGLARLLGGYKEVRTVYEATNGQELIDYLANASELPDVCLMDINMPVLCGYDATKIIREKYPEIKVLALSMYDDEGNVIKMLRSGARGYILKDIAPEKLVEAIQIVHTKGFYESELITPNVLRDSKKTKNEDSSFSDKELVFLKHCCTDSTYKEIALKMDVSERTVDGYRDRLFEKLGVKSRSGVVVEAIRLGLVKIY